MRTAELIKDFIAGETKGQASGGRLYIEDGTKLMNYGTCILQADEATGTWYLNETKYSPTTSKHQNVIRRTLSSQSRAQGVKLVDVPMGVSDLKEYHS